MAIAQGTKPVKTTSAPKKSKASPSHPPYIDMITEALVALKERTGSSHYAIAKHIEQEQKVRDLPPNFKKLLFVQLKRFVASGKLLKVKNSFKLPSTSVKKTPAPAAESKQGAEKKKEAAKKLKAVKEVAKAKSPVKKVAPVKAKKPKSIKSPAKKAAATKKAKK